MIRRIDFGWAVDREDTSKKQKKDTDTTSNITSSKDSTKPWPWKSLVENLQSAHQELSVIIDLINTVCLLCLFSDAFCFVSCVFVVRYLFGLVCYALCGIRLFLLST